MEHMKKFQNPKGLNALLPISLLASMALVFTVPALSATPSCSAAGSTGLTTMMTAHTGQVISHLTVDATGCDVGIYVQPGSTDVEITHDTITGAGIHGVFVQDSSQITIDHDTVSGNSGGVPAVSCDFIPAPCVNEGKAIQLVGTSDSQVSHNELTATCSAA
jgi:nitrous oxidase accessory protein NosD